MLQEHVKTTTFIGVGLKLCKRNAFWSLCANLVSIETLVFPQGILGIFQDS